MKKEYPKFIRGEIQKFNESLSKSEQEFFEKYKVYRKNCGCGEEKVKDVIRYMLQCRFIINKAFKDFKDFDDHNKLVNLINNSNLSKIVKITIKVNLNNLFGEYLFPDWWNAKYRRLYSNKKNGNEKGEEGDNELDKKDGEQISDKEVDKLITTETDIFWKTLLLILILTGCRPGEARKIKNNRIIFNDDETCVIKVFMSKNGKTKFLFLDKKATDYLKKQIEILKNTDRYNVYLFPSPMNNDEPITKNRLNKWFRDLCKKACGKTYTPYCLRHRKARELYTLADKGQISERVAAELMGHSTSMRETYVDLKEDEKIAILKTQAFQDDISPERKNQLEKEVKFLKERVEKMEIQRKKELELIYQKIENS